MRMVTMTTTMTRCGEWWRCGGERRESLLQERLRQRAKNLCYVFFNRIWIWCSFLFLKSALGCWYYAYEYTYLYSSVLVQFCTYNFFYIGTTCVLLEGSLLAILVLNGLHSHLHSHPCFFITGYTGFEWST